MELRKLLNEESDLKQTIRKIANKLVPAFIKYAKGKDEEDIWFAEFLNTQGDYVPKDINKKAREDLYLLIQADPSFGKKFVKTYFKGKFNEEGLVDFFVYEINQDFNDMTNDRKAPRVETGEKIGKTKIVKRMDTSSLN